MKGHLGGTKVVLRHLPPTISESSLMEHVDSRFSGRCHCLGLRPGKANQKHLTCSRAYIDFDNPDDVIEFAELFNAMFLLTRKGHNIKLLLSMLLHSVFRSNCLRMMVGKGLYLKVSGSSSLPQNATTLAKNSHTLYPLKPNKQREGTRRIRSTHLDEDTRQNQSSTRSQLEQRIQASIQDRDRKPPRPLSAQSYQKNIDGALEVKVHIEKQERRMRNKDRSDRGVCAPLWRSDGSRMQVMNHYHRNFPNHPSGGFYRR